ncbi:MAG: hypothetical protein HQ488_00635 [Parcubacteria group bacterium]|nr:hypothetical protein [Parcubacteria group bacterium]
MKWSGLILAMVLLGAGCTATETPVTAEIVVDEEVLLEERPIEAGALTSGSCQDAGGAWNDCGSACRGQDADVCVTVCAEYCECVSDEECPAEHVCTDFIEEVGICEPV